jgi:hypothetical protein
MTPEFVTAAILTLIGLYLAMSVYLAWGEMPTIVRLCVFVGWPVFLTLGFLEVHSLHRRRRYAERERAQAMRDGTITGPDRITK